MQKRLFAGSLVWLVSGILLLVPSLNADTSVPTRIPVRKSGNTIQVDQVKGPAQLVLEGRIGGGWKTLAVQYVAGQTRTLPKKSSPWSWRRNSVSTPSFEIPKGYTMDRLRVVAHPMKYPLSFLSGASEFSLKITESSLPPVSYYSTTSSLMRSDSLSMASTAGASVAVEESDIWKLVGDRLFFFNEYRGLQVFDVSRANGPIRTGTLRLAASGEQFFALNEEGSLLALLARDTVVAEEQSGNSSLVYRALDEALSVHLISVTGGVPALEASLPMRGHFVDSRLIGDRLYVLCSRYYDDEGNDLHHSVLYGFDLSNPTQPVTLAPLTLEGDYNPILQAFPDTLLIATTTRKGAPLAALSALPGFIQSTLPPGPTIHVLDISGDDGQPVLVKSLPTTGSVSDKFKLNLSNGVISVVSATQNWISGRRDRKTWVETFTARTPEITALGQLEIVAARGETLHATRFNGDRLYVVTFRNVDPLFIIDLTNPSTPKVTGELEIPGWSTYIAPYGDRLVSVGVESGRVAVSLFDVSDDTAPTMLSRVYLGEHHSWSEANYDEKAVGFFPDQGLLLVPYQTSTKSGWQNAVAVIEVNPGKLTQRSSITHDFVARRAAVTGDRIVSISGQEMIIVDAANLDDPQLLAQLSVSWKVDHVVPFGRHHLIQIEEGSPVNGYFSSFARMSQVPYSGKRPMIRVTRADDPDTLIEELEIGEGQLIGVVRKDDHLWLGQVVPNTEGQAVALRTWMFDVSSPPALRQISTTTTQIPRALGQLNFESVTALWPTPQTLVWHVPASTWWNRWWGPPGYYLSVRDLSSTSLATSSAAPANPTTVVAPAPVPVIKPSPAGQRPISSILPEPEILDPNLTVIAAMFPVQVSPSGIRAGKKPVVIRGPESSASLSSGTPYAANGFLFASYSEEKNLRGLAKNFTVSERRTWLKVVDFRYSNPVVRNRVSIPGELLGVSDIDSTGGILFTDSSSRTGTVQSINALVYDGVKAHLLNSWQGDGSEITATESTGSGQLFVATGGKIPTISSLKFDFKHGTFQISDSRSLSGIRTELHLTDGYLLASSWGHLDAFSILENGSLSLPQSFDTPSNLWIKVSRAAVAPAEGIWFPVQDYGVEFLGFDFPSTFTSTP